jgi:hypothetical protein
MPPLRTLLVFLLATARLAGQHPPSFCTTLETQTVFGPNYLVSPDMRLGGWIGHSFYPTPLTSDLTGRVGPIAGTFFNALWIGGFDPAGNLRFAGETFPTTYGWEEYLPGPLLADGSPDPAACEHWNRFWKCTRHDIETHLADLADNGQLDNPVEAVVGWPGLGNAAFEDLNGFPLPAGLTSLAPFFDADGDGNYNAEAGDYPHPAGLEPSIIASEIQWSLINSANPYWPSGSLPPLFDLHATVWGLDCDNDNALPTTYFQRVTLIHRGGEALDSVIVGLYSDVHLGGNYIDDYIGSNPGLETVFMYNADNLDEDFAQLPGYGENPPVTALTVLNQPLYKAVSYPYASPFPPDISLDFEFYNMMAGKNLSFAGQPVDFIFPDHPNDPAGWSMVTDTLPFSQSSRHIVASVWLGQVAPGDVRTIDYAYSYHRGPGLNHLQNVGYMFHRVGELRQLYQDGFAAACSYESCTDDCVWAGDANRDGRVDHHDLLPLGVGWDQTGPERPGPVHWAPEEGPDWNAAVQQTDYKHLDANGDGVLGESDLELIQTFYGLQNAAYIPDVSVDPPGDDLFIRTIPPSLSDTVAPGQQIIVQVRIDTLPEAFGVAATVTFDPDFWEFVTSGSLANNSIVHIEGRTVEAARIFLSGQSQQTLALLNLKARTQATGQTCLGLRRIEGIDADGAPIEVRGQSRCFYFAGSVGTHSPGAGAVRIFPNPASGPVRIEITGEAVTEVSFFDATGRLLRRDHPEATADVEVPTGGLPRGLVFVQVRLRDGVAVQKLILE